ncbi:MAG: cellulase family glycosylhydrolase [Candidatus Acidiferrum sp.]
MRIATVVMRVAVVAVRVAVIAALLGLLAAPGAVAQRVDTSLARERAEHLRRGINLSEWFAQVFDPKGYTKEHFESWTTAEDIALVKGMGFDHVRLSVNPQPLWQTNHADDLNAEYLGYLDAAVKMILAQDLAVILDMHPDGDFKGKLAQDEFVEQFADFWRAFARHYAALPPEKVFFEILNEPEMRDRYRWAGIQAHVAAAIREGAPGHTIIVEGARWADDDDLVFMEPLRDSNVIYNFHFYEPHLFTHQGATWGENYWHELTEVPYPSSPENVQATAGRVEDAVHRLEVARYGAGHWNAARIDADISLVEGWAKRWNVPVTCNEFGVYRKAAKAEERAAWLSDVRTALERRGMGWTMWDYSGGFGVVVKEKGQATVDATTVKALGLNMPARPH